MQVTSLRSALAACAAAVLVACADGRTLAKTGVLFDELTDLAANI